LKTGTVAIKESFLYGWEAFVRNFFFFLSFFAIFLFPMLLLEVYSKNWNEGSLLYNVAMLFGSLLRIVSAMALLSLCLHIFDNGRASIDAFKHMLRRFVPYFIVTTLYGMMLGFGLMLFVVPGLYLGVIFQFAPFLVLDKDMGPIQALKESLSLTKQVRWELFFFDVLVVLANLVGNLLFGLGVLVTVPVTFLAITYVYRGLLNSSGA